MSPLTDTEIVRQSHYAVTVVTDPTESDRWYAAHQVAEALKVGLRILGYDNQGVRADLSDAPEET